MDKNKVTYFNFRSYTLNLIRFYFYKVYGKEAFRSGHLIQDIFVFL